MEKKTKKLQLRKETIAVLNGQRMSHIIGGNIHRCQMNGQFYLDGEVINNDGNECVCENGGWQCQPIVDETIAECLEGFTRRAKTNGNGYCCHLS